MGFNSAFEGVKIVKNPGNGRLNNLNDPSRPQCVKTVDCDRTVSSTAQYSLMYLYPLSDDSRRTTGIFCRK